MANRGGNRLMLPVCRLGWKGRTPVAPDLDRACRGQETQPVACPQQPDTLNDGRWLLDRAEREKAIESFRVQAPGYEAGGEDRPQLAREEKIGSALRIIDRLDAQPVAVKG